MWSFSIMCTSAFTNAPEVSTSSPHPSLSSSSLLSLSLSLPLFYSLALKNTCPDHWNQALPEIWTISERSPPPTLKRFPQMLPHSTAFLYFPLNFWLIRADHVIDIWNLSLPLSEYISSRCCVLSKGDSKRRIVSFHSSHFVFFFNSNSHLGVNCC